MRDESLKLATNANTRKGETNEYTNWMTRRMYVYFLHVYSIRWPLIIVSTVGLSLMSPHRW